MESRAVRMPATLGLFAAVACGAVVVRGGAARGPIIGADAVTFVVPGDPSDPPRIVADFNGWRPQRMTPAGDGRIYELRVTLDPAARIEYLIAYRHRFGLDPGNPLTVPSPMGGPPRSELRMPQYCAAEPLPPAPVKGRIDEFPFRSRRGEARRIRVYVPPADRRVRLAVLYLDDGDIWCDGLRLPAMLDSLIGAGRMPPAIAVFIDSVDRHDDYEPGSLYRSVLTREIMPAIERRYAIDPARRALFGVSRSTVGALDTCAHGGVRFAACVLLAPAVPRADFGAVLPAPSLRTRLLMETGTYDIPLVADARALQRELRRRGLPVLFHESPEGHNHAAWRARLPDLLAHLFG